MLNIISLGAGVQSTTMALMAAHGEITPMPDCAIFADTGWEPKSVYDHLAWLMSDNVLPFPVHQVSHGDLWKSASTVRRTRDGQRTYIPTAIPVYTVDGLRRGVGRRNCTRDFKINPVNAKIRELAGLPRVLKRHGVIAEVWIGISADEAHRQKPNQKSYLQSRWPLLERDIDRHQCLEWMAAKGYPIPPRSACTFCPFRSDDSWLALLPEEFADAVEKEQELQSAYAESSELQSVPYLHSSRVPLGLVELIPTPSGQAKPRQLNMFGNECEGMCGV